MKLSFASVSAGKPNCNRFVRQSGYEEERFYSETSYILMIT